MRTLKELQAQIEELQKQKETLTTLCGFIPEKLAVYFKKTYMSSGYAMGEKIIYTCKGKELLVVDNRSYYTGRGQKYLPTHGIIKVDFTTKKALREYCSILKEMERIDFSEKLSKNERNTILQELRSARANNQNTEDLEKELTRIQAVISNRIEEFCEKGRELRKIVLENINYKESKIKDLICTAF